MTFEPLVSITNKPSSAAPIAQKVKIIPAPINVPAAWAERSKSVAFVATPSPLADIPAKNDTAIMALNPQKTIRNSQPKIPLWRFSTRLTVPVSAHYSTKE